MNSHEMKSFAIVMARIARANIKLAAMEAENKQREFKNEAMAYGEDEFLRIIEDEQIGFNDIIGTLNNG